MPGAVITWTKVTDPDVAVTLMPPWFASHMLSSHGSFGLLLTTGDVLRVTWMTAVHVSSAGAMMVDVMLDDAGVPAGVDLAWQSKHYLGAPVPGASIATVNLASVVAAIEFATAEFSERPGAVAINLPDAKVAEEVPISVDVLATARE